MTSIADRIRAVVSADQLRRTAVVSNAAGPTGSETTRKQSGLPVASGIRSRAGSKAGPIEEILGGKWREADDGSWLQVQTRLGPGSPHGRDRVCDLSDRLHDGANHASLLAGGAPIRQPFVFFDLETTGLSGGAGTYAFLIGLGRFDEVGGFVIEQYLLARVGHERALLTEVAAQLGAGTLVSFNGKSFDAPLLESRFHYHRLTWPLDEAPHIDLLHPARRFWGVPSRREHDDALATSDLCSLLSLENRVLGAQRADDVSGFEVPSRYFRFVRTGDARPLVDVLSHNRLDLLSLAGLTGRLLQLLRVGPTAARDDREALALGRIYFRAGLDARAREALQAAADGSSAAIRLEALRLLALAWRRARGFDQAAACWRRLLEVDDCPRHVAREASEALAIHHEHRVRDLTAARTFAVSSLKSGDRPGWSRAVSHRLARLDRKMRARNGGAMLNLE